LSDNQAMRIGRRRSRGTRRIAACAAAVLAVLAAPAVADACDCGGPGPPCQQFESGAAILVGQVIEVTVESGSRRARVRVTEAFHGVASGTIDVFTGGGGGDCGYGFQSGQSYLIYAERQPDGKLYTGICSRTRPVNEASLDLAYLRERARRPRSLGSIYGEVRPMDQKPAVPVSDVRIVAQSGGRRYEATPNTAGVYELGVPTGRYTVTVQAPAGWGAQTVTLYVDAERGCRPRTHFLQIDGRISGRVVDWRGRRLPNLTVEAMRVREDGSASSEGHYAVTDDEGQYELEVLRPGSYVVGIGGRYGAPADWQTRAADATIEGQAIDLGSSQRVRAPDVVVRETAQIVPVTGIARDRARRPIVGAAIVVFHEADTKSSSAGGSTSWMAAATGLVITDEKGRFTVAVPAGRYRIGTSRDGARQWHLTAFDAVSAQKPLELTLPD
jgi:hypothetical protein